jgi:hypothetical protein
MAEAVPTPHSGDSGEAGPAEAAVPAEASSMVAAPAVDAAGKNPHDIICARCSCKIIARGAATFVVLQVLFSKSSKFQRELPCAVQRGQPLGGSVARDLVSNCWKLTDMFAFENVGFCREVESTIKVRKKKSFVNLI